MKPIVAMAIGALIILIIVGVFYLLLSRQGRYLFSAFIEYLMFWR